MPEARSRSAPLVGVLCGIGSAAGFSLKAVLAKLVYRHGVDTTTLLAMRMALSLPFYVAIFAHASRGATPIARPLVARIALVGVLGYFVASYLDFLGLRHISAGLERIVLYLYPTLVIGLSFLLFGRRIGRRELVGLAVAYTGLGIALSHDVALGRDGAELAWGTGFVFFSALTYAGYVVGSGELAGRVGSARFTAIAMIAATIPMLAVYLIRDGVRRIEAIPPPAIALAAVMAVFATVVPSLLMTESIRRLGSSRAAIVGSIGPVTTLGLESACLGEPITMRAIVGTVLVVAGVLGASVVLEGPARASSPATRAGADDPA